MRNRVVLSILLGVFVLGMTSYLPSVYAVDNDYTTFSLSDCEDIPAPTTWSVLPDVCTLTGNWNMASNDHLTVSFDTNFVIATTGSITNLGKITITSDGTTGLVNSGLLHNGEEATITIDSILRNEADGQLTNDGGTISGAGALVNLGTFESFGGTVSVPTITNFDIIQNAGSSVIIVTNDFTNESTGGVANNGGTFTINGNFNNFGEFLNDGGVDISGLFTNHQFDGFFTNQGDLTLDASGNMINAGFFESLEDAFVEFDHSFTNESTGEFENSGEIVIEKDGQILNHGTFTNNMGTPGTPNGLIILASAPPEFSRIDTTAGDFINDDRISNECGDILGTITGEAPIDACYGFVLISSPADQSTWSEDDVITFTATSTDKDAYGNVIDLTPYIVWTSGGTTLGTGGSINVQLSAQQPVHNVKANAFDSLGNPLLDGTSQEINAKVKVFITIVDEDGDGKSPIANEDCDDNNATIYLGATEVFDGVDNNCDNVIDEGFVDFDEDGFASTTAGPQEFDCDDTNAAINPNATEVFDFVDNNCDGTVDEGFIDVDLDGFATSTAGPQEIDCDDNDALTYPGAPEIADNKDNDCDGIVDEGVAVDNDLDGFTAVAGDCNDNDAAINPNATEVFDFVDNNCDGTVDEGFIDVDLDGFATSTAGPQEIDCDDNDALTYPGAPELLDGKDNDCDVLIDEDLTVDADGDTFTTPSLDPQKLDCNDDDITINPDATELFDLVDNNCDGTVDEGFIDVDLDGFATSTAGPQEIDCDDNDALTYPGAPELLDNKDNNCNGDVDEAFDEDGDGFTPMPTGLDCDDTDVTINPNATELLDNKDNNCDGTVDEGFDMDGDTFTPTPVGLDCDDTDPLIYPGALEIPNGKDNDCDSDVNDLENKFTVPEFQANLDDKTVRDYDKQSDKLSKENGKLESKNNMLDKAIEKYEAKAAKAIEKGHPEKAAKYLVKADELKAEKDSNLSLIEINSKQILVIDMSIGKIPVDYYQTIIVEYDNITEKTTKELVRDIDKNLKEIQKLADKAAKYNEKANKALEGNEEKAAKYDAKAEKYHARADYYTEKAENNPSRADYYEAKAAKYDAKAEKYDAKADKAREGNTEKAAKYQAKATQALEEIAILVDLNDVLICAINFTPDMLEDDKHDHHDDKHDHHDD